MNAKRNYQQIACAILALWLATVACGALRTTRVGDVTTETQSVELGDAMSARVRIDMPAGVLNVQGGADQLMQATFRSNVAEWQAQVDYKVSGSRGELVVDQPGDVNLPVGGNLINEWTIQLNNGVPLELEIHTGAGENTIDLSAIDVTTLQVDVGAGTTNLDLSGNWNHDVSAAITGGVGELSITLPDAVGVRINMDTALVSVTANNLMKDGDAYVNDAYGSAPHTLTLELDAGVGAIELVSP